MDLDQPSEAPLLEFNHLRFEIFWSFLENTAGTLMSQKILHPLNQRVGIPRFKNLLWG